MQGLCGEINFNESMTLLERVNAIADRFEAVWKRGRPPRISDFLPVLKASDRVHLVHELILLDQIYREKHGDYRSWDDYLREFPELALSATLPIARADSEPRVPIPHIPGYEIIERVASGGMGTVYK